MSFPVNDSQFAAFDLDPLIARVFYAAPIAPSGTPAGPIADMLRLNTGVAPTSAAKRKRLGLIAGDAAGFPNGRRLTDDVVDIVERVGIGGILSGPSFNVAPNNLLGDGVNAPDVPPQETFPYVHYAYSRHISPGDPTGCGDQPTSTSSQNSDAPPANQGGPTACPQ